MTEDLTPWLNRVKKATGRSEVFSILDEFRKGDWTDEQCAMMSKVYIRVLERAVNDVEEVAKPAEAQTADNGPVWYEKM